MIPNVARKVYRKLFRRDTARDPKSRSHGYVEVIHHSHIAGWAYDPLQTKTRVQIFVNDLLATTVEMSVDRPDIEAVGLPKKSGYIHFFRKTLDLDDTVTVKFPNGAILPHTKSIPYYKQRLGQLLSEFKPESDTCLEMGALDRPILKRPQHNVFYLDHASTDEIKAKYAADHGNVIPENVVPVDYVWDGNKPLTQIVSERKFDFVIASHVIEHVANPIGWLANIAEVLKSGGVISLAIPEKTRTFDKLRPLTTISDLVYAYIKKFSRPSAKQVFEHEAFATENPPPTYDPARDTSRLLQALRTAREIEDSNSYKDAHCHVFTYESFRECWDMIARMELIPLELEQLYEPLEESNEFIAILRKK